MKIIPKDTSVQIVEEEYGAERTKEGLFMRPDRQTMICYCHDVSLGALADYIRKEDITHWRQVIEDREFLCGETCEKCWEEGYNNDGFSLAMAVGMVQKGYL